MDDKESGILDFRFPCGRKLGDMRGDEMTITGTEMQRLGKIIEGAEAIMKKSGGKTPLTAKERRIVATANAIGLIANPFKHAEFEQRIRLP